MMTSVLCGHLPPVRIRVPDPRYRCLPLLPDMQAEVPVYNYSVPGFYGFRGEYPGQQQFDRSDFSGYASGLQCLHVTVKTGAVQQPGGRAPFKWQGMHAARSLLGAFIGLLGVLSHSQGIPYPCSRSCPRLTPYSPPHTNTHAALLRLLGSLDMRVRVGGPQVTPKYQVDLGGTCGFPLTPTLSLSWPARGRDLVAIVWKDAANRCGVCGGGRV